MSIDGNAQPAHTPGGTHSGSVTVVREIMGNDISFPDDGLLQFEATYLFDTRPPNLPAAMPRGLITRSVPGPEAGDISFAIIGGTGPYDGRKRWIRPVDLHPASGSES